MRLLVVCTSHPLPADDGLRLQLAHLLRGLAGRHEVTLVTVTAPGDDLAVGELCQEHVGVPGATGARHRVAAELRTLFSRRPVLAELVAAGPLPAAVLATAARVRPDVVHLQPGWTAELAGPLRALLPGVAVVLAPLDASAPNFEAAAEARSHALTRALTLREGRRMVRFEADAYRSADAVVVVTERDADLLRPGLAGVPVEVVTNGVEVEHWLRPAGAPGPDPGLVVLSGAMRYAPNVDAAVFAAREVLPLLRRRVPTARLRLVGRDPAPEVLALAGPDVEVTGTVDDLRPHLWAASVYLCPMRTGTGVKNKLLEALAAGCPSVATPLATQGLALTDGLDVRVGTTAAELAAATADLLEDPVAARRTGEAAARLAHGLSWERTVEGFEAVYAAAVARAAAVRP